RVWWLDRHCAVGSGGRCRIVPRRPGELLDSWRGRHFAVQALEPTGDLLGLAAVRTSALAATGQQGHRRNGLTCSSGRPLRHRSARPSSGLAEGLCALGYTTLLHDRARFD
ncbi:unnamed protein product, partial [Symbiodinium necroappetens]